VWRAALVALAAVFMFGTSSFVWISFVVAAAVWAVVWRRVWWNRKAWPSLLAPIALFAVLAAPQFLLALHNRGAIGWGDFRSVIVGGLIGRDHSFALQADQVLTWLGLPLVAAWVFLVEMGITFGLYVAFVVRALRRGAGAWQRILALYPVVFIPLGLLLLPPNFGMRGILPAQLVMVLGAAMMLARLDWRGWRFWQKASRSISW
jgi:hypothetical protein